ncbi:hypothetical protein ACFQ8C_23495 [Streptomyces sp. NPDC056503]|uniref:hypothetical protein n=1 Tax=Streptomyces sp. NPDC056503 TaxID=3345842 RepID=UPI00369FAB0A
MSSAPQGPRQDGSRFVVDLGGVKLPAILEKQVETDIRAVVLSALSESEGAAARRLPDSIFDRFPNRTLGLWLDPDVPFPDPWGPLGPKDHTLILREVLSRPVQVIRYLDLKDGQARPTGEEVLEAALQVEQIDDYTKERMRAVLELLPRLEEARAGLPRSVQQELRGLQRKLEQAPGVEGKVRLLRDPGLRSAKDTEGYVDAGLEQAALILEDGASTIYAPDFSFYRLLSEGRGDGGGGGGTTVMAKESNGDLEDTANADAVGAAAGGGAGLALAGVGAAAGAAAGAAGASLGWAIGSFLAWLF